MLVAFFEALYNPSILFPHCPLPTLLPSSLSLSQKKKQPFEEQKRTEREKRTARWTKVWKKKKKKKKNNRRDERAKRRANKNRSTKKMTQTSDLPVCPHGEYVSQTSGVPVKQVVFFTVNHRRPHPFRELIHSNGETIVWTDPGGT